MGMRRAVFLLISICIFFRAEAQMDFRKGYIITNSDDTVKGHVDYKNLTICTFKESLEETDYKTFMPGEIIGFGFNFNRWFISKTINDQTQVFLECLTLGSISLYAYKDIFYMETSDTLVELEKETKKIQTGGAKSIFIFRKYIGLVNVLLKECAPDVQQLNRLKYSKKSFIKLVEDYNNCVSSDFTTYRSKLPWIRIGYGGYGG
jgi:hypothetical protein